MSAPQKCVYDLVYEKIGASYDVKRVSDMYNNVENVEISKFDDKCLELSFLTYFIDFSIKHNIDWYSPLVILVNFQKKRCEVQNEQFQNLTKNV